MLVAEFFGIMRKQLVDEQEPYLWGDDEFLFYLKNVLSYVFLELGGKDAWVNIDVVASKNDYSLGQSVVCYNVLLGSDELIPVPYSSFYTLEMSPGRPKFWAFYNGKLYIAPVPDGAYRLSCFIKVDDLDRLSYGDVLPVDSELIDVVVKGFLWQAYMKQDSEIFDLKKALDYKTEFFNLLNFVKMKRWRDRNMLQVTRIHSGLL